MRHFFNEEAWEFTAKAFCTLGTNIVSIGFASYFFKDLPLPIRIGIAILGTGLVIYSIYMISKKGAKQWK